MRGMVELVCFVDLKELAAVGLFDAIREKAGELLSGATDKVGELAGDLPGVQDLSETASDAAGQVGEQAAGAADELGAVAENLPEVPPEYRP